MPDKITVQLASVGLTQTCPNQSVTQTSHSSDSNDSSDSGDNAY